MAILAQQRCFQMAECSMINCRWFWKGDARADISKATVSWLQYNIRHYYPSEHLPPNSPDLFAIENVWSIVAAAVYASSEPQTLTALERRLWKPWRSISLTTVQNLIVSVSDRLKTVIRNKGDTSVLILSLCTVLKYG